MLQPETTQYYDQIKNTSAWNVGLKAVDTFEMQHYRRNYQRQHLNECKNTHSHAR